MSGDLSAPEGDIGCDGSMEDLFACRTATLGSCLHCFPYALLRLVCETPVPSSLLAAAVLCQVPR